MTLDAIYIVAGILLIGAFGAIGLSARGRSWRLWQLNPQRESSLTLLGRLSLSPQSKAYLVDAEGAKVLVVVCGSSAALQIIGPSTASKPFQQVLEAVER